MAIVLKPPAPVTLVQLLGVAGVVLGALYWAPRLQAAAPVIASPERVAEAAPAPAAAQWFANRPAPVQVIVSGVLDTGRGPVAILSVNGGAPRTVRVGESLARGVQVTAIDGRGLTLQRGQSSSQVSIASLPAAPALAPLTRH